MKEMTVKQICEELGYEVKIVKEPEHNIPGYMCAGQIYKINGDKYMVASLGCGSGLIVVSDFLPGYFSSSVLCGTFSPKKLRNKLIELNAKYLGYFNEVFKTI